MSSIKLDYKYINCSSSQNLENSDASVIPISFIPYEEPTTGLQVMRLSYEEEEQEEEKEEDIKRMIGIAHCEQLLRLQVALLEELASPLPELPPHSLPGLNYAY